MRLASFCSAQHFISHVISREERLYTAELPTYKPISFPSNGPVLALIEGTPVGLFPLLEEQILLPKGTDERFLSEATKRHSHIKAASASASASESDDVVFSKTVKMPKAAFQIMHYAGSVIYDTRGERAKRASLVKEECEAPCEIAIHDGYIYYELT